MIGGAGAHVRIARQILGLLEQERRALIEGRLDRLGNLAQKISTTLDKFEALPPPDNRDVEPLLAKIREKAGHNTRLADASRRGLREAQRIVNAMEAARGHLHTYSNSGVRRNVAPPTSTRDRRT